MFDKKTYKKRYREKNKEKVKLYRKDYREKNKEKIKSYKRVYMRKYSKEWNMGHRQKIKIRHKSGRLRREYNMTIEQFEQMIIAQDNRCYICGNTFGDAQLNRPCVDHDHTTNKVRSLLCSQCNIGLGGFKDNIKSLESAIIYLRKWSFV